MLCAVQRSTMPTLRATTWATFSASMATLAGLSGSALADAQPAKVRAVYDISFNGLNVGSFEFNSEADAHNYTLNGQAKVSALFGAFSWGGETRASGKVVAESPKPDGFTFDFKSNSKAGAMKMGFTGDTVSSVVHVPPLKVKDNVVPLQAQHLKGVVDPMSAVMLMSKGTSENPCTRRLPVFDGKLRFDLMLSPRGQVQIKDQQSGGQPAMGYVCRVKYIPIAGHKIDDETKFFSRSNEIEIILRPIPSANVFVPYQITIPTIAGPAVMTSRRVDIVTAAKQQIALVR
jgi:Protein of unknown function (DUF3108)